MPDADKLILTTPDDWHLHLRDGDQMAAVVTHSAERFARAIVMPNLQPPITTTAQALAYRERIRRAVPKGLSFEPLMTLYLTDNLPAREIALAKASGQVYAVKLYPAGATTNSDDGVTRLERVFSVLAAMEREGLPLLVHGEVTDADVDLFDREQRFIEGPLTQILNSFPGLRVVFEHITTAEAVAFVREGPARLAATITAHHLLFNRNALLVGGIRPHYYCLPVLKREHHRRALLEAATSGHPRFFLGTDSAPHAAAAKESRCGCAGIYTAHAAIECYAEAFEQVSALERLEAFASHFGPDFYGLPHNETQLTLRRLPWRVEDSFPFGVDRIVPLRAGEQMAWQLERG